VALSRRPSLQRPAISLRFSLIVQSRQTVRPIRPLCPDEVPVVGANLALAMTASKIALPGGLRAEINQPGHVVGPAGVEVSPSSWPGQSRTCEAIQGCSFIASESEARPLYGVSLETGSRHFWRE